MDFESSYNYKNTSNDYYYQIWICVLTIKEQQQMLEKQSETLAKLLFI